MTRILYRLRLASEQRPFDVVSLAYILPLIFIVLSKNGIDEPKEDQGEQVLLALEFLSFHPSSCEAHIFRYLLLACLLTLL